jgi:uncharacterized protein
MSTAIGSGRQDIEPLFIDAYGDHGFRLNGRRHEGSLLLVNEQARAWAVARAEDLDSTAVESLLAAIAGAHILILGTGTRLVPLAPILRARVEALRIGVEVMDTGAACRTFNILRAEGRMVAAALIAVP